MRPRVTPKTQASPEGFAEALAQQSNNAALWHADEVANELDKLHHVKYMTGFQGLLLSAYDGRSSAYRRVSKRVGKDGTRREDALHIVFPHLSVLQHHPADL